MTSLLSIRKAVLRRAVLCQFSSLHFLWILPHRANNTLLSSTHSPPMAESRSLFLWILSRLDYILKNLVSFLSSTHSPPMESLDRFCPVVLWGMCCCTNLIQSGRAIWLWKHDGHWETQSSFGISWSLAAGDWITLIVLARPEKVSNLVFYSQSTSKVISGQDWTRHTFHNLTMCNWNWVLISRTGLCAKGWSSAYSAISVQEKRAAETEERHRWIIRYD